MRNYAIFELDLQPAGPSQRPGWRGSRGGPSRGPQRLASIRREGQCEAQKAAAGAHCELRVPRAGFPALRFGSLAPALPWIEAGLRGDVRDEHELAVVNESLDDQHRAGTGVGRQPAKRARERRRQPLCDLEARGEPRRRRLGSGLHHTPFGPRARRRGPTRRLLTNSSQPALDRPSARRPDARQPITRSPRSTPRWPSLRRGWPMRVRRWRGPSVALRRAGSSTSLNR